LNYKVLGIYEHIFCNLAPDYLQKILTTVNLQGIIITTTTLVKWLFKEALNANCVKLLQQQIFVTINPKIEQALISYGVERIIVVESIVKIATIIGQMR
jgi:hypothetical protein